MKNLFKVVLIAIAGAFAMACNNGSEETGFRLSSDAISFYADGVASNTVITVSGADWSASVTEGEEWLTLTPASGADGASFTVEAMTNAGVARQGSITVIDISGVWAPVTVSINQFAAGSNAVLVDAIELDTYRLAVMNGGDATVAADVYPPDATNQILSWRSNDPSIATVVNGVVTGVSEGSTTIVVSATDGSDVTAVVDVTVNWLGEVWFHTDQTWTVGGHVWSDGVMAQRCRKTAFNAGQDGGPYYLDCMQNVGFFGSGDAENPVYSDWFSFRVVEEYGDELCPDGWRVPTIDDFNSLVAILGDGYGMFLPTEYYDQWGLKLGGYTYWTENPLYENQQYMNENLTGDYWSSVRIDENSAWAFRPGIYGVRTEQMNYITFGFTVRCVKNAE